MRLRSPARLSPPDLRAVVRTLRTAARTPVNWPPTRWAVALTGAVLCALAVGLPTAVVPNPFFARAVPAEWWNYPALVMTGVLGGLLLATYVRRGGPPEAAPEPVPEGVPEPVPEGGTGNAVPEEDRSSGRLGAAGGVLTFFAVGCPVCNKLVLLVLGTSGALTVWQPVQPGLAVVSLALLGVATVRRLAGETACPVRRPVPAT